MTVKATSEGLVGRTTSSGYVIDNHVSFVALPSVKALHKFVKVTNSVKNITTIAQVLDVGPWNEHDDAYVLDGQRPQSETGIDTFGRQTNKAGIDLGPAVWKALGMEDNTNVDWEFLVI